MPETGDTTDDCPFPIVAEALRPYIRSRQEVAAIRQGLQATLPLNSISLEANDADIDPASLSGVRKAYWRALEAHRKAQSRYESLKAELSQLVHDSNSSSSPAPTSEDSASFLAESYVPLIRQKETHRKLKVIEAGLSKIEAAGGRSIGESLDNVAKRAVGEIPALPSNGALPDRESVFNAEYDLTQLKKAVLSTRQQLNDHQKAATQVNGVHDEVDEHADLKALQRAHNELTIWMETQLAAISDGDGGTDTNGTHAEENGTNGDSSSPSVADIEELYELYLEARKRLLDTVANPPSPRMILTPSSPVIRRASEATETENRPAASELVVPYLAALTSRKQREQTLLQQGTYARRQMIAAESQTQAVLSRLADESHLLPPDLSRASPHGRDWAKAAEQASRTTADFANERIKSGLVATESAASALEAIKTMPDSYDALMKRTIRTPH